MVSFSCDGAMCWIGDGQKLGFNLPILVSELEKVAKVSLVLKGLAERSLHAPTQRAMVAMAHCSPVRLNYFSGVFPRAFFLHCSLHFLFT